MQHKEAPSTLLLFSGFLPTFGPAFVPVYGSRRHWEIWEGKEKVLMNKGKEEGCSYRGRVLISLRTNVGAYPSLPTTDMDDTTFNQAKVNKILKIREKIL